MVASGEATRAIGRLQRPTPLLVWGRAGVLGSVACATGVVSHAVAGGLLPGVLGLTLLFASCVLVAAACVLRQVRPGRAVLLVLLGQTWAHGVLSATAGHRGPDGATAPTGIDGPLVVDGRGTLLDQYRSASDDLARPGQEWLLHQVEHFTAQSPAMLAAHLGGAALLGLFLALGEDALFKLIALALARSDARQRERRVLALISTLAACAARCHVRVGPLVAQVSAPQVLQAPVLRHRGPPFVLAA